MNSESKKVTGSMLISNVWLTCNRQRPQLVDLRLFPHELSNGQSFLIVQAYAMFQK